MQVVTRDGLKQQCYSGCGHSPEPVRARDTVNLFRFFRGSSSDLIQLEYISELTSPYRKGKLILVHFLFDFVTINTFYGDYVYLDGICQLIECDF